MQRFTSEERQLLDDSIQGYLVDNYSFEHWRAIGQAEGHGYDADAWRTYAELGWLGIAIPESFGGSGGGATELAILMAAAGRHMVREPLLGTIAIGAASIELAGTEEQRREILPQIASGRMILAFCHMEPEAGYARDYVRTVARQVDGGFIIDGAKSFALGAHIADLLIVSTRMGSEDGPMALFLVPGDSTGVRRVQATCLDGRLGATTQFSSVQVNVNAQLGAVDDARSIVAKLIDRGAIFVCAEACGAMSVATHATVEYLKVREQFGQPLSRFQVLQHRLVEMSVACEEARAVVHAALEALDDDAPHAGRAIWMAKVQTAHASRYVAANSIQLHGGMGMTDELAIGHFYKRLAVCESLFGDADWYLAQLGSSSPN
ncbi:acyl-CoA dehydrogenase family protein [Paraburkholderia aspalathi]|uniref:acyl-CoA dehydrogenase family protein n=1 Tax=Paraburkholderia aspalathi TaxID=1324617 RepID=UPI001B0DEDB3|nr:acyl-CoA dehydrogenase [Paraburkholderia aspalathi]CAE6738366.1 Crotonobetainyl-CoA reductase [Paraburkholderia aspalathi]